MDSNSVCSSIYILLSFLFIWNVNVYAQNNNFVITEFGAIADGKTDSKQVKNQKLILNAYKLDSIYMQKFIDW